VARRVEHIPLLPHGTGVWPSWEYATQEPANSVRITDGMSGSSSNRR
jgi:hypothetical protein